ncbi:MAG: acyl-CoA thioesterase [Burkholderiaceae bacterium]
MASDSPDLSAFVFAHRIRVRWAEADMQGVVFNGHYLTYFDIGITEYLRAACETEPGLMQSLYASLYVAKSTVNYRDSARFDDWIEILVRTGSIGNSSLVIEFAITRDEALLVDGQSVYVYAPDGKSARLPDNVRQALSNIDQT